MKPTYKSHIVYECICVVSVLHSVSVSDHVMLIMWFILRPSPSIPQILMSQGEVVIVNLKFLSLAVSYPSPLSSLTFFNPSLIVNNFYKNVERISKIERKQKGKIIKKNINRFLIMCYSFFSHIHNYVF